LNEAQKYYERSEYAYAIGRYRCAYLRLSPRQQELVGKLPNEFWEEASSLQRLAELAERAHALFGALDQQLKRE
jgi:hypothetical protein